MYLDLLSRTENRFRDLPCLCGSAFLLLLVECRAKSNRCPALCAKCWSRSWNVLQQSVSPVSLHAVLVSTWSVSCRVVYQPFLRLSWSWRAIWGQTMSALIFLKHKSSTSMSYAALVSIESSLVWIHDPSFGIDGTWVFAVTRILHSTLHDSF